MFLFLSLNFTHYIFFSFFSIKHQHHFRAFFAEIFAKLVEKFSQGIEYDFKKPITVMKKRGNFILCRVKMKRKKAVSRLERIIQYQSHIFKVHSEKMLLVLLFLTKMIPAYLLSILMNNTLIAYPSSMLQSFI